MNKIFLLKTKNQKIEELKCSELNSYGIICGNINTCLSSKSLLLNRFIVCILKWILVFFATTASLLGFASAFEIEYNQKLFLACMLLISLLISFTYFNKISYYIGYIAFLLLFAYISISYYPELNSGFQAITNIIFEKYSDYFALKSIRESTELVKDRYLTISMVMIYLGSFLNLLLNMAISRYMSLVGSFILTFPFIEIALYINLSPNIIYMAILFAVYISVGILSRTDHFKLTSLGNSKENYSQIRKKNLIINSYKSSGKGLAYILAYSFAFAGLFMLIFSGIFYSDYDSRLVNNKLKAGTDEMIKTYLQNGAWGFFDRYSAKGGLSNGKLGGVSMVSPDYETDLIATFVPLSSSTIYLKGFIGNNYQTNSFEADTAAINKNSSTAFNTSSVYALSEYTHGQANYAKMILENVDSVNTDFMPYDSLFYKYKNSIYSGPFIQKNKLLSRAKKAAKELLDDDFNYNDYENKTIEIIYDPYIPTNNHEEIYYYQSKNNKSYNYDYECFVYDNYLNIPSSLQGCLHSIVNEAGLINDYDFSNGNDCDNFSDSLKSDTQVRLEQCEKLKNFFAENFSYTMAPGATPYNKDTVLFFLEEKRKGFCAHFAASATLILRSLGIPARYCEGYVILPSDILNSTVISNSTKGFISSDSNYNLDNLGLVNVEISDANAHAWVEVYIDGYGWIPYEFTPPSTEEVVTSFNFTSLLNGLFLTSSGNSNTKINIEHNEDNTNYSFNLNESVGFIFKPLIIIFIITILILFLAIMVRPFIEKIKIFILERKKEYSQAIILKFCLIKKRFVKYKLPENMTLRDYENFFNSNIKNQEEPIHLLIMTLSSAYYSKDTLEYDEYKKSSSIIKMIITALKNNKQ